MNEKTIITLLEKQGITVDHLELFQQNRRITDYIIDQKWLLRISEDVLVENCKLARVERLSLASHIVKSGCLFSGEVRYYYIIIEYHPGSDLYATITDLTRGQSLAIGEALARFMIELHTITGSSYDIGHYVPTIPNYQGTWQAGHMAYIKLLETGLAKVEFEDRTREIIQSAINYVYDKLYALEYQTGPRLLHNDLHPKNIIVHNGILAGIIDWECSQYGERDFELVHLMHWCLFPPDADKSFVELFYSILRHLKSAWNIPYLEERLTIYQLEHELNQLIWHGNKGVAERVPRINAWLAGLGVKFVRSL